MWPGKASFPTDGYPRVPEDDADVESLPHQAGGGQEVDQGDGSLIGNGVDEDERLLARVGFDVGKYLLLDVKKSLAFGGDWIVNCLGHGSPYVGVA
jgi:hypothetical protein